jgi:hypothetical protein
VNLFEKKATEFDKAQDASLKKLNQSVGVLSGNDQALYSHIVQLSSSLYPDEITV